MNNSKLPQFPSGWFAIAFSKELKKRKILSRTFIRQELVLFRTDSAIVTAAIHLKTKSSPLIGQDGFILFIRNSLYDT